jgi:hypothetical protein
MAIRGHETPPDAAWTQTRRADPGTGRPHDDSLDRRALDLRKRLAGRRRSV